MIVGTMNESSRLGVWGVSARNINHPRIVLNIMEALLNDPTTNAVCHVGALRLDGGVMTTALTRNGAHRKSVLGAPTQHTCIGR